MMWAPSLCPDRTLFGMRACVSPAGKDVHYVHEVHICFDLIPLSPFFSAGLGEFAQLAAVAEACPFPRPQVKPENKPLIRTLSISEAKRCQGAMHAESTQTALLFTLDLHREQGAVGRPSRVYIFTLRRPPKRE